MVRTTSSELAALAREWGKPVIHVMVRDTYTSGRDFCEEECVTTNEGEADSWFKEWKRQYEKELGYSVTRKIYQVKG